MAGAVYLCRPQKRIHLLSDGGDHAMLQDGNPGHE